MKKLTIIIPTMWRSKHIETMLRRYAEHDLVEEVLLIDNAPEHRPKALGNLELPKVTVLSEGVNIYVNPAWNWGVSCAVTDFVALVNDDLLIEPRHLNNMLQLGVEGLSTYELIGMHTNNFTHPKWAKLTPALQAVRAKAHGFGTFMFMLRAAYVPVPNDIKIWRGDAIQVRHCETAVMSGIAIHTEMSVTVNSNMKIKQVAQQDMLIYRKKYPHYHKGEGNMVKICYTSVAGRYDRIVPPEVITQGWQYWAFVDANYPYHIPFPWVRKNMPDATWMTPSERQRVVKIKGPYLDAERPYNLRTVTIDGNMVLRYDLDALLAESGHKRGGITLTRHHRSDCAYNEVAKCRKANKDTPERLDAAEAWLKAQKHPKHAGLMECGFMIRDWRKPRMTEAMNEWLDLVLKLTHRDQITLPWIMRKYADLQWTGIERELRNTFVRIQPHTNKPLKQSLKLFAR